MTASTQSGRDLSKWLAPVGTGLVLALVVTVVLTPGAGGYEPSVYAAYPAYFWVLLVGAFVIGQYLVLRGALASDPATSNWRLGFLLTLLVAAILVFMPYFRGYPVYGRGDVLTHVGYVLEIQATGGDPFQNIYQNIHQLVLALSYATGVEPLRIINAVAGVISVFSLVAAYALVAAVFDRRRALLTLPFVVALLGGTNVSPYAQSVLLFPFVLYLLVKTQQTESFAFRLALIVVVISAVLYHPLTAVFLIVVFLGHYVVVAVLVRTESPRRSLDLSNVASSAVVQLSVVVFLSWYYNFVGIILRFETVFQRLLRPGSSETKLDSYTSTVSEFSPALVDIVTVAAVRYGQTGLLLGLGLLFVLVAFIGYFSGRPLATPYLATFALGVVVFSAFGVLFMLVDLIGGFGRPLVFAEFFGAFVAGSLLYHAYVRFDRQASLTAAVTVLFVVLVVLSVATLYPMPLGSEAHHQVTEQDLDGAEWYLDSGLDREPLEEQGIRVYRFQHALNGTETETVQQEGTRPPDHFNYTVFPTLGDSYDTDQYLVLTERGRTFYPTVHPDYEDDWRFTPADYDRLERDPTVSRLYDNGEFDVYRIESTNRTAPP